jgi:predicted small secreted protein
MLKFLSGFILGIMAAVAFYIYMLSRKYRGRKKVLRGFKKLRNRGKCNV